MINSKKLVVPQNDFVEIIIQNPVNLKNPYKHFPDPPLSPSKNQLFLKQNRLSHAHFKVLQIDDFGGEWGRRGSPWAHTQSQRSHGLQEAF